MRKFYQLLSFAFLSAMLSGCSSETEIVIPPPGLTPLELANLNRGARAKNYAACVPKEYPKESRRSGQNGNVVIGLLIDIDGTIIGKTVFSSTGYPLLDSLALDAVSDPECIFYPATINGKPIKSWTAIRYAWRLT